MRNAEFRTYGVIAMIGLLASMPTTAYAAEFFYFLDCGQPTTIGRLIWQHIVAGILPIVGGIYWGASSDCGLWGWLYWLGAVNAVISFVIWIPILVIFGIIDKNSK